MKKVFFIGIAMVCVSVVNAQNLSFGPSAGFGHSCLSVSPDQGTDKKFHPSYAIGGKLVYSFVTNWGISADVKFSSEGGSMSNQLDADERYTYNYRANYIRVPLQGIYFFGELGDAVRPKISLGPSFGFLVGGTSETELNGTKIQETPSSELFTGFDIGANIAAGANFRLGENKWINADITYYHGFSDVSENSNITMRNRGIGINVGVTFPLGTVKPK